MPQRPVCLLSCPGYQIPEVEAGHAAVAMATRFAAEVGWDLELSPRFWDIGGSGFWLPTEQRRLDLPLALAAQVWWAARGGYGCLHLADAALAHAGPLPLLIGFSDVTVLHAVWWRRGRDSLYGLMPSVPHGPQAEASLLAQVRGEDLRLSARDVPAVVLCHGRAEGPCFAACLSVLVGLCGTPLMPDLAGAILALEDLDERPYRVDRCLEQLHRAGSLDRIAGLVFGRFPHENPAGYGGWTMQNLLSTWAQRLGVPCLADLPFGHDPDPICLANRRRLELDLTGENVWSLEQRCW